MRLRRLGLGLIALAFATALAGTARAETEPATIAVLGLEATDVSGGIADAISEQLRQKVATAPDLRLVAGKDLVELKLVFSCADEGAGCIAQAGRSLDAQKLIYGSVKRVGDDYAVWLKLFDVRHERVETWLTETISKRQTDAPSIQSATARWFAKLTGRPVNVGTLQISANAKGATVTLDGLPVGATTDRPLIVPEVAVGIHELIVEKPGRMRVRQQLAVAAGQTVPVNLSLKPAFETAVETAPTEPAPRAEMGSRGGSGSDVVDGRGGYRKAFWVTLAAGLLSTAGAVKFGLDVKDVNKQLDPFRRFSCTNSPTALCDSKGMPATDLSQDNKNLVASKTDEGNRDQTLQWVCIGVGSALGIASGYLLYRGYLDSDDEKTHKEAHQGLRIYPTAGASSGGILAEFDF